MASADATGVRIDPMIIKPSTVSEHQHRDRVQWVIVMTHFVKPVLKTLVRCDNDRTRIQEHPLGGQP